MNKGRPFKKKADHPVHSIGRKDAFITGIDSNFRRSLMNLRNSIDAELKNRGSKVIMFTSAVKGEGKTLIAAYFARVLALSEYDRVLVIDCALDAPRIHELFGIKNEKGIVDYLLGEAKFADIVRPVDEGVLDIITTGSTTRTDATQHLFNSDRMKALIPQVEEIYDYVIIDTSAVLDAPETPLIGAYASGIVMVIQAGKTKREVVKRAIAVVEKLEGRFIGSVLNRKKYYIPEFIYRRV